jgi:hypothetical protein
MKECCAAVPAFGNGSVSLHSRKARRASLRDRFRYFLARHDYRNGAVTINTSDWYYNQRLLTPMGPAD